MLKNKKNYKKNQYPNIIPTWRLDRSSDPNRAGNLTNLVTHAIYQIDWNKIVTSTKGWSFMFQHYYGGRH